MNNDLDTWPVASSRFDSIQFNSIQPQCSVHTKAYYADQFMQGSFRIDETARARKECSLGSPHIAGERLCVEAKSMEGQQRPLHVISGRYQHQGFVALRLHDARDIASVLVRIEAFVFEHEIAGAYAASEQEGCVVVGFSLFMMLRIAAANDDTASAARAPALAIQLGCDNNTSERITFWNQAFVAVVTRAATQQDKSRSRCEMHVLRRRRLFEPALRQVKQRRRKPTRAQRPEQHDANKRDRAPALSPNSEQCKEKQQ